MAIQIVAVAGASARIVALIDEGAEVWECEDCEAAAVGDPRWASDHSAATLHAVNRAKD